MSNQDRHHLPVLPHVHVGIFAHSPDQLLGLVDDGDRSSTSLREVESALSVGADALGARGEAIEVGVEVLQNVGQSQTHPPILVTT